MKERILNRAFELFRQYGIKTISMDAIAIELGISKKTIYKWFTDKDQLVTESLSDFLDEIKHTSCTGTTGNAIEEFCSTIHAVIQKLLPLPITFFYDLKKYHPQAYQIWQEFQQEHIVRVFQANFVRGIQSGLYRRDVNPEITARLYLGQLQIIYSSDLFPQEEFNRQDTYRLNLKNFVLGLVSPAGCKVLQQALLKYCHL